MKLYLATVQSDMGEWEGNVEAGRAAVAVQRAAERIRIGHWATIKLKFVRTIEYCHVLIFYEKKTENSVLLSAEWVEHREHGTFKSAAMAYQYASTILNISTMDMAGRVSTRRVRA